LFFFFFPFFAGGAASRPCSPSLVISALPRSVLESNEEVLEVEEASGKLAMGEGESTLDNDLDAKELEVLIGLKEAIWPGTGSMGGVSGVTMMDKPFEGVLPLFPEPDTRARRHVQSSHRRGQDGSGPRGNSTGSTRSR
jgi:hypothetical protein